MSRSTLSHVVLGAIAALALAAPLGACLVDDEAPRLSSTEQALDPLSPWPPWPDPVLLIPSCENQCGGMGAPHYWFSGPCSCAPGCEYDGTCCYDYSAECAVSDYSCQGRCGGSAPSGCYCDDLCTTYGDCCSDVSPSCEAPQVSLSNDESVIIGAVASTGGGAVVTGTYEGDVVLPNGETWRHDPSGIAQDAFVARYSSAGELLWSYTLHGSRQQFPKDVAVDGQGFVYVTGSFQGVTSFGRKNDAIRTSDGYSDGFVLCLSPSGEFQWVRTIDGPRDDFATQVVAGDRGWAYVSTQVAVDATTSKMSVRAYDRTGAVRFVRDFDFTEPASLALDAAGNLVVAGSFVGTIQVGVDSLTSAGDNDIAVLRYSPVGGRISPAFRVGGSGDDLVNGLAADGWGGILLAGAFNDQLTIGTETLTAGRPHEQFLAAFQPSGTGRWARRIAGANAFTHGSSGQGLAVDRGGNVWFVTSQSDSVNFGGGWIHPSATDAYVAGYTPAGNLRFLRRLRGSGTQLAKDVAVDDYDQGWVGGWFGSVLESDAGTLTSSGLHAAFLLRILP